MTSAGAALRLDGVEKAFGSLRVLGPVTIEARAGEFLTLLGSSGSGKTTLLHVAAGHHRPDRGRVLMGGRDITALPPRRRNIGMVFQNYALFPHLSVFENVAYGLRVRRVAEAELARRTMQTLSILKLDGLEQRKIDQLSGGQQQRVALARAMVIEPNLLLMDEPLGALDRQLRKHVQIEVRRLHLAAPRTTIYVTHDQEEALALSDRVAVLSHGVVEQVGTPQELYAAPVNAFVAGFVGESNLLPVQVASDGDSRIRFTLDGAGGDWPMPRHSGAPRHGPALLLARPEWVRLARPDEAGIAARVEESVYLGELTATRLRLASGQDVWMRRLEPMRAAVQSEVRIAWDVARLRLLPINDTQPQPRERAHVDA